MAPDIIERLKASSIASALFTAYVRLPFTRAGSESIKYWQP